MVDKEKIKIVGFRSGHDASYCILENGIPVVHEELERTSRIKNDQGDGLKYFFSRNNKYDNVKYFTHGNWGGRSGKWAKKYSAYDQEADNKMKKILSKNNLLFFEFGHHTCHAANAFYTSSFDKALIITVDGGGFEEGYIPATLTISEGFENKIVRIRLFRGEEINIGKTYHKATAFIFKLSVGPPKGDQAGTVMAMATLGKPKYTDLFSDFNKNWRELKRISRLSEQDRFDVASSLQEYTEQSFKKYVSEYILKSGHENLCISGGVSLNCVMLGKIRSWFPNIKRIFCDPIPYDAGLSLGSARYLWHQILNNPRIDGIANQSPYLGITYSKKSVIEACSQFSGKIRVSQAIDRDVVNKLNKQKIVSVFGGGSESGRRALGNRSILADPRDPKMKELINERVKHRQWFRPLAPSILEEKVSEWFVDPLPSPYMTFALKYRDNKKSLIPSVVHYDGTGRLQTVNKQMSPWFHGLLSKWESLTGLPILINTSFNDSEPIVETPVDALNCFLKTNLDLLYFFDYGILVEKT